MSGEEKDFMTPEERDLEERRQRTLGAYQEQISGFKKEIDALEVEKKILQEEIDKKIQTGSEYIAAKLEDMTQEQRDLQAANKELKAEAEQLAEAIKERTATRDGIQTRFDKVRDQLVKQEEELKQQEGALVEREQDLKKAREAYILSHEALAEEKEKFSQEREVIQDTYNKNFEEQEKKTEALAAERATLETAKSSVLSQREALEDRLPELERLKSEIKVQQEEVDAFNKGMEELVKEKALLKDWHSKLKDNENQMNIMHEAVAKRRVDLRHRENAMREAEQNLATRIKESQPST